MNFRLTFLKILFLSFLSYSCKDFSDNRFKSKPVKVNLSDVQENVNFAKNDLKKDVIHLAISAMTSPKETLFYYEELVHYLAEEINIPIKIEQFKTYKEVNDVLENKQIEIAFICSGAFSEARNRFPLEILAVPKINGKASYNAYIIVNKSSSIKDFKDLKGKSFAFTDPLSNTGRAYAINRVKELGSNYEEYFSKIIFTYAHDYSIQAVSRGLVDGATIDGLIFNYMKRIYPQKVKNIRVIEISEEFGIPPIVVHKDLGEKLKGRFREVLINMSKTQEGKSILDNLLIDEFVLGSEDDYNSMRIVK